MQSATGARARVKFMRVLRLWIAVISLCFGFFSADLVAESVESPLAVGATASPTLLLDFDYVPGEVLVRFDRAVSEEDAIRRIRQAGASAARRSGRHGLFVATTLRDDESMLGLMGALTGVPGVRYSEANYIGEGGSVPNDPLFSSQWHLEQPSDIDIDASGAWDIWDGYRDVTIAVLDSGTRFDHPELNSQVWVNPNEIPGNFVDDDLNGYVDDWRGWDFVGIEDNDPSDDHYHGTLVTGVALATVGNAFQVAGVSLGARYVPVKILDSSGSGTSLDLIEALEYVADLNQIQLVNLSIGNYPQTTGISEALEYASIRTTLIGCAGNGGPGTADIRYPGAHPSVVSVGWTESDDSLSPDSSTGSTVDLSAPGSSIKTVSAFPPFGATDSTTSGGCSLAVPVVVGVSSLIHAYCPGIPRYQLEKYLRESAVDLGPSGWDSGFGWGRINAHGALLAFFEEFIGCYGFEDDGFFGWSFVEQ